MIVSMDCVDLVKKFEGLSLKPYLCPAKIPTIGYGNTMYESGVKVTMADKPITQERAEAILRHHLDDFGKQVQGLVKTPMKQSQFDALCCFAYNVGVGNLKSSTLLKLLNQGKYKEAGEQFLRWDKAGGVSLPGLVRRRHAEKDLFDK